MSAPKKRGKHRTPSSRPRFPCQWVGCGRIFISQQFLGKHLATHATAKPFPCSIPSCSKRFLSAAQLRDHAASHAVNKKPTPASGGGGGGGGGPRPAQKAAKRPTAAGVRVKKAKQLLRIKPPKKPSAMAATLDLLSSLSLRTSPRATATSGALAPLSLGSGWGGSAGGR